MRTLAWVATLLGLLVGLSLNAHAQSGTIKNPAIKKQQDRKLTAQERAKDNARRRRARNQRQRQAKVEARRKKRRKREETNRVFRKEANQNGNVPFETKEPADMQSVYRSPPRPKKRPSFFDYSQVCGKYRQSQHLASICILEDGRIFGGMPRNIDENDKIVVYLIVRKWVSTFYRVQMKPVQLFNRGNAQAVIPQSMIKKPVKPVFIVRKYDFGPFDSGNVVLSVSRPSIGQAGVGFVDIRYLVRINALVPFNLAVAFVGITPISPPFKLIQERGSSITRIALSDEGPIALDLIIFAKIYSWQFWDPKLFAGREILKPPLFVQRFSINIGLSFKDLLESFFVGVGFELSSGFDLVLGANLRVADELAGGFQVGNPFSGDVTEIPTVKRFRVTFYFGVSITPEIFTAVFSTLTSGRLFGR